MRRLILAILAIACTTFILGNTKASAFGWDRPFGWYRPNGNGYYCFRGPRWDYAAAYYQSYSHHRRAYGRACDCRLGWRN
jgi:hypothetical protein